MATSGEKKMLQLCDLPDEILIRILSLIPLKSAVATSVLSRRWQFVWARYPNLQIDQDMFSNQAEFISFVDRAMVLRHGSALVSFSLTCELLGNSARINSWITSSIQCNVKELLLHITYVDPSYLMPSCIFESQLLVKFDLTMQRDYILRVPSSIRLSNLKCLRLTFVTFPDDESTEKLLWLPMLEELVIGWCSWRYVKAISISAPKLLSLEIHEYNYIRDEDYFGDSKVQIFADGIRSFLFEGNPFNEFRICGSNMQLSKAQILVWYEPLFDDSNIGGTANNCYKLINGLSSVQELTLTDDFLMLLQHSPELSDTIPVFECLTQLNIDDISKVYIDRLMLMKIFERCPILEHLDIMKEISHRSRGPHPLFTASCFLTHLKKIQIRSFSLGQDYDIDVTAIDMLLRSASVLEEMVICLGVCNGVDDEDVNSMNRELGDMLNKRPRASKDCKISLIHDFGWEMDD